MSNSDDHTMLESALRYADRGYRVFPCEPRGKRPLTQNGFKDATTDEEQIREWWEEWPTANIGLATGEAVVVDCDPLKDGSDNPWPGDPDLQLELAKAGAIAQTGRGGRHYFFRNTGEWGCSAGKLADAVDVRGHGGYVIAPPSIHQNGTEYFWIPDCELDCRASDLPEPPAWLEKMLSGIERPRAEEKPAAEPGISTSISIPEGERNSHLTSIAGSMHRRGLDANQMLPSLLKVNDDCCQPPLAGHEVRRIAESVARYPALEVSATKPPSEERTPLRPLDIKSVCLEYPAEKPPIIQGLLREGETMNIISASKMHKSWMVDDLAVSVATGLDFLGMPTVRGRVLVLDNELFPHSKGFRLPKILNANGLSLDDVAGQVSFDFLRGRLLGFDKLQEYFDQIEVGDYKVIILDSLYRFTPPDRSENDNAFITGVYNLLDRAASRLDCAFVCVHHSAKGSQAGKSTTDIGAGAGAQSRAADAHMVLVEHADSTWNNEIACVDAALRTWPKLKPFCIRWIFPCWVRDESLDPTRQKEAPRRRGSRFRIGKPSSSSTKPEQSWTPERFVAEFVGAEPKDRVLIEQEARERGLSGRQTKDLIRLAEAQKLMDRKLGDRQQAMFASSGCVKIQHLPASDGGEDGCDG